MKKLESGVLKMGEPCYNCKCPAYSTKDRIAGKCTFSPDCGDFVGYDCTTANNIRAQEGLSTVSNHTRNLPCYNDKCAAVFQYTKITGCPFSDTCPDFMAVGFGSAKKKTNFDHIRTDITVDDFVEMFAKHGCPPGSPGYCSDRYTTCQSCWKDWLESEYHN